MITTQVHKTEKNQIKNKLKNTLPKQQCQHRKAI
jgi:hypothetical protein